MARALLCAVLVIALGCIDESAAVAGACVETEVESLLQRPASVRDQILHIVDFREKLLETSVPDDLVALKRRFVNYYTEVGSHIKRSVHTDLGQTVDCIPFLKQPALLWAGEEVKKEAVTLLAKSTGDAQDAAGEQEANQEQEPTEHYGCGPDEVPLPRPSLQALRRGLVQEFRKTGSPTGGLWPSAGRDHQGLALLQVGNDDCRTIRPPHPGPPNHTYSTSPICKTHGSRTAFAVLELAGALAEVPSSGGHTLNQLWWKGVPPKSKLPVSLETGWLTNDLTGISDARSSQHIGTRLFVYSTPNAYLPKDDCEGGNAYDHWGGFVQYPGSPALGVYTVNKLRSVFLYRTVGSTQEGMPERVEFYLAKLGKDYGKPRSVASKRHLVGYWPKSHFCQGFPKHEDLLLYTGLEVFVPSQCPGMPRTASGRILGWGTDWNAGDPEFYPMLKDDGSEAVFLATAKQEWQASVGYDPKWLAPHVDFSGTYRPVSCVVPGKLPCEDTTCPRR